MKKSSKKVLDCAYKVIETWAAEPSADYTPEFEFLIMALEQYDKQRFFAAYEQGVKRSISATNLEKEKAT
jgi:hypothetical protein